MGLLEEYKSTLKPLAVEEPIDVYVHRPLAFVLARALRPTPISANMVTFGSILFGLGAGYCLLADFAWHMQIAGACIFLSAIFDCADGQLARMRGTSSAFGRMLDGTADLVVSVAAVGGALWVIWTKYSDPAWFGVVALGLGVATAVTGSFHTGMYDHYKNVYLRLTSPGFVEGESYATALQRYRAKDGSSAVARLAWPIYLFYLKSQEDYVHRFDPHTSARLDLFPKYSPEHADTYRRYAEGLMRVWRGGFGFGSLVFGLSVATALNALEWYMLARLTLQNAVFYGYLRPRQRRASRAAFREMGVALPDRVS